MLIPLQSSLQLASLPVMVLIADYDMDEEYDTVWWTETFMENVITSPIVWENNFVPIISLIKLRLVRLIKCTCNVM